MASETFANALRRHGGMWGSAWDSAGNMLTDVVQVTATTTRGRIEIPLVGQQTTGFKPGRMSSEGSIAFQKVDSGWELKIYEAMTLDVDELRRKRDAGEFGVLDGNFDLLLKNDDPHSFGKEVWSVTGCMIWQLEIGINVTEDFIQRELPLTYVSAKPVEAYTVVKGVVTQKYTVKTPS